MKISRRRRMSGPPIQEPILASRRVRRIPAGEFKAKCLALLHEVHSTGEVLIVTKRGRRVAKGTATQGERPRSLLGSIVRERDIVGPTGETWNAETRRFRNL